jgi:hypothetical protein
MSDLGGTLVISDGGLAGLIATAIAAGSGGGPGRPGDKVGGPAGVSHAIWAVLPDAAYAGYGAALAAACERAASRQAEAFGMAFASLAETGAGEAASVIPGQRESAMLVRAVYAAAGAGCRRVIWPVVAPKAEGAGSSGPDLESVARAIDRATLVSRLVGIDLDGVGSGLGGRSVPGLPPEVRVETPLVDLSDVQLAGLAVDMGVPVELCWWWGGRRADVPGAEAEHARWAALLGRAGPAVPGGGRPAGAGMGSRPMAEVKPGRAAVASDDKGW